MLDLPSTQAEIVRGVLLAHAPRPSRIWVFGSRAKGEARRFSDLDLAVDAGRGATAIETASLEEAFEESELPWRVDVVDVQTISESFNTRVFAEAVLFTTLADG